MIVLALFFVSGAASLLLETVFRRELTLYVGSAATATSLTLATFLGGLAIGAALFGKLADRNERPLRLYGFLELGVGVAGALVVALLAYGREALLAPVRAAGAGPGAAWIAAIVAAAVLLPPTILMGGTLPALVRHGARGREAALGPVAVLYGINTLGGSAGAALGGFVLFEAVGVSATGWLGAGLSVATGAIALAVDRGTAPAPAPAKRAVSPSAAPSIRRAAIAAATLGGAAALGYEVVWTRLLALPLRSYSYSFSLMLSLFLFGLVVGSLTLAGLEGRIRDPLQALARVQLAAGSWVALSVLWLPRLLAPSAEAGGFGAFVSAGVLRAAPVVIPPTILSGMALPLAVRAYGSSPERVGAEVGAVYAANTAGSIVGALLAGLALVPLLGASRSLAVLAAVGALSGAAAAQGPRRTGHAAWAPIGIAALCAAAALVPPGPYVRAFSRTGRSQESLLDPLFFREGATDTVAVVRRAYGFRDPDAKSVVVNGIAMTATVKPVWRYMAAEGHLPALFAPAPARALLVCVGTGITLGALASHDSVASVDAVDLSESMLLALPVFERENAAAFRDPKVRLVHADGRHLLELGGRPYDLITLEPPPPIIAGSVHLYTLDFYRLCRARLSPGGVVAQWLPLHAQSLASARATARTFLEAFPNAQLWLPSIRDAVLIGSERPLRLDPSRLRAAYAEPRSRASLEAAYLETPAALLGTYLLDRDGIARWSKGADLITDDRPWMEFFRRYGRTMADGEIGTLLAPPPGSLDAVLGPGFDPAFRASVEAERASHRLYLRSEIDKDAEGARASATSSRATRFGLYRLGCDEPQLTALREETASGPVWRRQVDMCARLTGSAPFP